MNRILVVLAGLLFGAGVTVSGMVNPAKVLNFMDLFGTWDPTLLFVMGAGLAVTLLGYRLTFRRTRPLCAARFVLPDKVALDARLLTGAALFGLGWGLSGFCPGPAVAALVFGDAQTWLFVASMAAGMIATKAISRRHVSAQDAPPVEG